MGQPNDIDTGTPIEALAGLREDAPKGFVYKVRDRLERRFLTSHFVDMVWSGGAALVREFLDLIFQLLSGDRREEGDSE